LHQATSSEGSNPHPLLWVLQELLLQQMLLVLHLEGI
jgi:hypothetical protein